MDARNIWVATDSLSANRLGTIHPETHATVRIFDVRIDRVGETRGENAVNCAPRQEFLR